MSRIDVNSIVQKAGLDFKEVAIELFPKVKYPVLALQRVAKADTKSVETGEALLNEKQIRKLSCLSGLSIEELFQPDGWKTERKDESKKGILVFSCKDFTAELNTDTNITTVYKAGSLFCEKVLHTGAIPLSEYIKILNTVIT